MATLSLPAGAKRKIALPERTAKKVHEIPTERLTGKYAVMRQLSQHAGMKFGSLHETREQAEVEAHRLAGNRTDVHLFLVVEVISTVGGCMSYASPDTTKPPDSFHGR